MTLRFSRSQAAPGSIGAGTIAGIFVVVLFFCGVAFSIGGYYIMKKKRNFQDLITSINPDYHSKPLLQLQNPSVDSAHSSAGIWP